MKDLVLDHFEIDSDYSGACWLECTKCPADIPIGYRWTLTTVCTAAEKHWNEVHCDQSSS